MAGIGLVVLAGLLPLKIRPWPLVPLIIVMVLFGVGVPFVVLVAGGPPLALINFPLAAMFVAGSLVVFDAAW